MVVFIALALLPLFLAFLKAIPGLLVLVIGLFGLGVAVTIPKVAAEYPAGVGMVVLAGIATAAVSIWGPRFLARKIFERGCLRMVTKFKRGEEVFRSVVVNLDRRYHHTVERLVNQFIWAPRTMLTYPRRIELVCSVLIYFASLWLIIVTTEDVRQEFLNEIAVDRDKQLYPWSVVLMFALALFATHWIDRRVSQPERYLEDIYEKFHWTVNRHLPLDEVNNANNQHLVSKISDLGRAVGFSGDRLGTAFFDPVAASLTSAIRSGSDPVSLATDLNDILRRGLEDLARAKAAMHEVVRLKKEVMFILQHAPDISSTGFQLQQFLKEVDDWDSLSHIVFNSSGTNALAIGRERAEQIASEVKRYIADRRGENLGGDGAAWHGSARASGSQHRARDGSATPSPPRSGRMSRAEALSILGLTEGAIRADIVAAHRRLIKAVHPDVGGTAGLAARLNEARDLLLAG